MTVAIIKEPLSEYSGIVTSMYTPVFRMMYEQPSYGYGYGHGMPVRRPDSLDDRHVMAKHTSIYPNDVELQVTTVLQ